MLNFFSKVTLVLLALIAMLLGPHAVAQSQINWLYSPKIKTTIFDPRSVFVQPVHLDIAETAGMGFSG